MKRISFLALCLTGSVASADSDCAAFAKQIDESQRIIAMLRAEARGMRNPDALNARILQELQLIQINVTIALKACPAPSKPITLKAYSNAASKCQAALLNDPNPPACDMSTWSPD